MINLSSRFKFAAAGLLTAIFVSASAAQAPPPKAPPTKTTADTTNAYRVKQVLGAKVSISGDVSIGTVDDLVFNDSGSVEYLIVANDGKLVTVPWEAAKFNFEKQTATLSITQDQYKVIPTYTTREYPVYFEPTYRTQAYRWYGLTPRPFRR